MTRSVHHLARVAARAIPATAALLAALALLAPAAHAQYFGRNKVQYETFDFQVLRTPKFDVHYYAAESVVVADAARMAERWYARHSQTLRDTFAVKPLIFYADHPDFQQTNVVGGFISQGTGGVTEGLRTRVVMPFTGVYADNDHVLGHELVHVFQYDIAGRSQQGMRGMNSIPLWLIEGMAEYLSLGRNDPNTAMWLRDAAIRNDIPTIKQLTTDPRYFPYRYGQALWAYIGGTFGDDAVNRLYRESIRIGFEPAVRRATGLTTDALSKRWLEEIRSTYLPLVEGRQRPGELGPRVLEREGKEGEMDVSPALSPDGRHVAFFTRRGLFTIDLYVADAQTGRIVKQLTSPNVDNHFEAISFINSAGSWSPDGRKFAFVVFADGDNQISIFDVASRRIERQVRVRDVGAINDPAWGPDDQLAFSGLRGGISDIYVLDLNTSRVTQLTDDKHADVHPTWSPDGRTIAFATDRGPETSFERLTYSPMRLAVMDRSGGGLRVLPGFENAKHINPQYSPDGRSLYFVSDRDGFTDVYRLALEEGTFHQVTRLATGVSGITYLSPAISVARQTGRMMLSVFENGGQTLRRIEAEGLVGTPVGAGAALAAGAPNTTVTPTVAPSIAGVLPPTRPSNDLVTAYLADATTGLPSEATEFRTRDYRSGLRLDYIGSPGVGLAVGGSGMGAGFVGGVQGFFADMLNDNVVGATVSAQGQFKDIGGEVMYLNQRRRWNTGAGLSHVPYFAGQGLSYANDTISYQGQEYEGQVYDINTYRIFVDQAYATAQYPFSSTRRFETNLSVTRQAYDVDVDRIEYIGGQPVRQRSIDGPDVGDPLTFGQVSAALVGDWSYFGFTSPVAGGRYRFEATPTLGSLNFTTLLADYRRYVLARPFTLAFRGMHYGRYGKGSDDERLNPLFLGRETLIRGYAYETFEPQSECSGFDTGLCPQLDRLVGSRIALASAELRIPLFGSREFGLLNVPFLPTEISPFVDAGLAWNRGERPSLTFQRNTTERVPVVSAGVSARVNLLGYAVGEAYFAYPFQREEKGWHFGFQLAPGW